MNLKVPGAILPLGCAILSTRAITIRGGWYNPPLGELGLILFSNLVYFPHKEGNHCKVDTILESLIGAQFKLVYFQCNERPIHEDG